MMAPNFTDFKLHNTGTTQREYDSFASYSAGAFLLCRFLRWQLEPPTTSPPPNSIPPQANASDPFHLTVPP